VSHLIDHRECEYETWQIVHRAVERGLRRKPQWICPPHRRSTLKSSSSLLHLKLIHAHLTTLADTRSRWKRKQPNPRLAQIIKAEPKLTEDLARIMHETPAATGDMAPLPGILGSRSSSRTEQVRLRSDPAVP
jgi:hypothetical protein